MLGRPLLLIGGRICYVMHDVMMEESLEAASSMQEQMASCRRSWWLQQFGRAAGGAGGCRSLAASSWQLLLAGDRWGDGR